MISLQNNLYLMVKTVKNCIFLSLKQKKKSATKNSLKESGY